MERYQLNLQRSFQSLVPMERVAWNLANSGVEVDFSLFGSLRFYLQRSLYKVITTLKRLKQKKIAVIQQVNIFSEKFVVHNEKRLIKLIFRPMICSFDFVKSVIASY